MQPAPNTPCSSEPGVLRLTLEQQALDGGRLASLVDTVRRVSGEAVVVERVGPGGTMVEFTGPMSALRHLEATAQRNGLRPAIDGRRWSIALDSDGSRTRVATASEGPAPVLIVDPDAARGRRDTEVLGRSDVRAWAVGRIQAARSILMHTNLRFEVIVLHHRVPDGRGTQLLDALGPAKRTASVVVIDDRLDRAAAREYRARGVFRYIACPRTSLQLIGHVQAAIIDCRAWNAIGPARTGSSSAPPRVMLDVSHAADRLQHVCQLSQVEREVGYWVLLGLRDLDIASRLGQSERTAKRHVGKVLCKAGVQNRASLWAVLYHDGRDSTADRARQHSEPDPSAEATGSGVHPSPGRGASAGYGGAPTHVPGHVVSAARSGTGFRRALLDL